MKKISDLFYDTKFIHSDFGKIPILGPIGDQRINSGLFLDLDDIKKFIWIVKISLVQLKLSHVVGFLGNIKKVIKVCSYIIV